MSETVIAVAGLHKKFRLPHQKAGSIKNVFTGVFSFGKKTYETQLALQDINFEVKKGEFFGIVGRNGSGKSTLLKLLAGIYQPSKGHLKVNGRIIPFIELGVGFNGELTGRENVFLNGALMGFSEKEIQAKYDDIVAFAELDRFMDQKLKNYSSGMQVRLAFSVATRLAESDILLIDEVLAVGDANFQRKCFNYFRELKRQGKTVVFVTHDMSAVREYCNRALLIDSSHIIALGDPDDIAERYLEIVTSSSTEDSSISDKEIESRGVMISNASIKKLEKQYEISYEVSSKTAMEVVAGFKVTHGTGTALFGSNTKLQKQRIVLRPNKPAKVAWKFDNIFSDGTYYIDLALADQDAIKLLATIEEAFTIDHSTRTHSPYPTSPNIELHVQNGK